MSWNYEITFHVALRREEVFELVRGPNKNRSNLFFDSSEQAVLKICAFLNRFRSIHYHSKQATYSCIQAEVCRPEYADKNDGSLGAQRLFSRNLNPWTQDRVKR